MNFKSKPLGRNKKKDQSNLKALLDALVLRYNQKGFIEDDPVSIPHSYTLKQDCEISGFFAATFAWGQRITIINKSRELLSLMGPSPYDFIVNHLERDRLIFSDFKHRTFQYTDTLYFLDFLQRFYRSHDSLEEAFVMKGKSFVAKEALERFHNLFFDSEYAPLRTRKHVATPTRKSTCKRLNMYLRWMCRKDSSGVDLGLWNNIPLSGLMIPFDVHVEKTARNLGLLTRKQRDWQAVEELTDNLRLFDPNDPVKYDYALFGMSILKDKDLTDWDAPG